MKVPADRDRYRHALAQKIDRVRNLGVLTPLASDADLATTHALSTRRGLVGYCRCLLHLA